MSRVRRVAIVGRDAELWLTALTLQRALQPIGIAVEAVELPTQLSAHDCLAASPALSGLHDLLGLDRKQLITAAGGIPVTGQRYSGWSADPLIYGFDAQRGGIENVDILQHWTKARGRGLEVPFQQFSPAAVAAARGRVGADTQPSNIFGTVYRGYHLDAAAYSSALKSVAEQRGVAIRTEDSVHAVRTGDWIERLEIEGNATLDADLFIDASGAEAVLAATQPGNSWQSWSQWLPVDRIAASSAPVLNPRPPFADVRATAAGWVGLFPLAERTTISAGVSSSVCSDADVNKMLAAAVGTDQLATPDTRHFEAGLRTPWVGNCIAVGHSAAALLPLDLMSLHMVQVGLTNLIAWFPAEVGRDSVIPEARSYNAVVERYAANVRDFQAAHYRLNRRVGEELWDNARDMRRPDTLDARIDLFAARGLVPVFDEDTFDELLWSALFAGSGLVPASYDRRVDDVSEAEVVAKMQRLIDVVEENAARMPTVQQYLGR